MDVLDQIRDEHERVDEMLEEVIASARGRGGQGASIDDLRAAILPHMRAEEAVLYPRILEDDEAREPALRAFEEHRVIASILEQLVEGQWDQERTTAKLLVLRDIFERHVDEEEEDTFSSAHELFEDGELEEMLEDFALAKQRQIVHA